MLIVLGFFFVRWWGWGSEIFIMAVALIFIFLFYFKSVFAIECSQNNNLPPRMYVDVDRSK